MSTTTTERPPAPAHKQPTHTASRSPSPALSEATTLSLGTPFSSLSSMSNPVLVAYPSPRAIAHPDRSFADLDALVSDIVKRILYVNVTDKDEKRPLPAARRQRNSVTSLNHTPAAARSTHTHAHVTLNVASATSAAHSGCPVSRSLRVVGSRCDQVTRNGEVKSKMEFRRILVVDSCAGGDEETDEELTAVNASSGSDSESAFFDSKDAKQTQAAADEDACGGRGRVHVTPSPSKPKFATSTKFSTSAVESNATSTQLKSPTPCTATSSSTATLTSSREVLGPIMGKDDEPSLAEEMRMLLEEVCDESQTSAMMSITVRSFAGHPAVVAVSSSPLRRTPSTPTMMTPVNESEGPIDAVDSLAEKLDNVSMLPQPTGGCRLNEPCHAGVYAPCEVWGYQIGPVEMCQCGPHLAEGYRLYKMNKDVVTWMCSSSNGIQGGPVKPGDSVWKLPNETYI
ncbi:hypothetical protein HDU81_010356 [Chytriomyces hyalinus]|nr:hypothetical protein HDU81_010356 [Chytriomyces hyalinus]